MTERCKLHEELTDQVLSLAVGNILPVPIEPQWLPIESAPGGELVLLYEDGAMRLAFKSSEGKWEQPPVPVWRGEHGDALSSDDLRRYGLKGELALSDCLYEPTHWMPLPAPPREI